MSDGDGEITVVAAAAPDGGESPLCRELTVVDSVAVTPIKTTPLELPQGWTVKKVPRPDRSQIDKYYYEPGTGQRFKSLRAVQRYLTDANCTPPKASKQDSSFEKYYERRTRRKVLPFIADDRYFRGPERKSSSKALKVDTDAGSSRVRKSMVSGGMLLKLDNEELVVTPHTEAVVSPFNLPDGWVVEEVPRRNSTNNYADKYYYEPGTRRRFVSLVSVKRHLAKAEEDKPLAVMFDIGSHVKREAEAEENKPLAVMFNIGSHVKKLDSKKKSSKEKVASTTFGPATPPDKIKWVLTDSGGSTFKPCIGEAMVSDTMVQRWAKRFMISISGKNNTSPSFER